MTDDKALAKVEQGEQSSLAYTQMDEMAIQSVKHNLEMLARMVKEILIKDQDYGVIPGTQSNKPSLWDGGATNIRAGFNCYSVPNVVDTRDDGEHVRYVVRADIVSRLTGKVVACGIGTASTKEVKYAFRWVWKPEDYGHDRKSLRTRTTRDGSVQYRIPNPDIEDLDNTIIKMAAKRAEVDGTMQLPGVARVFTQDVGVKLAPAVAAPPASEQDTAPEQPASQEAPRGEAPANAVCITCGYRPMLKSKFGPKMYHYTDAVDAQGKKIVHEQPVPAPKPAEAPAPKPAGVVVSADKATPEQVTAIYAAGAKAGVNEVLVKAQVAARFKLLPEELTAGNAQRVIEGYTQRATEKQAAPSAAEREVFE